MIFTNENTMKDFGNLSKFAGLSELNIFEIVKGYDLPKSICDVEIPDFEDISFKQLDDLWEISTDEELLYNPAKILLGLDKEQVNDAKLIDYIQFIGYIAEKIGQSKELFNKIPRVKLTAEEKQALSKVQNIKLNESVELIFSYLKDTNTPIMFDAKENKALHLEIGFAMNWKVIYHWAVSSSKEAIKQRELHNAYNEKV